VRKAIARMLESGLIRSVDYNYESLADPQRVVLQLTLVDETPLLPASIEIPGVDRYGNIWNRWTRSSLANCRARRKPCAFTFARSRITCAPISGRMRWSRSSPATTPAILAESYLLQRPAAHHHPPARARIEYLCPSVSQIRALH